VTEFIVKRKQLKHRDCYVYALVPRVSDGGSYERDINMTDIHEQIKA